MANKLIGNTDSVDELTSDDSTFPNTSQDPSIRNRYIKRIGINAGEGPSDTEPLLD